MRRRTRSSTRVLPDGASLRHRLLAALREVDHRRVRRHLGVTNAANTGDTLLAPEARITTTCVPNRGVFPIPTEMRDGARYSRIRILQRKRLKPTACECDPIIRSHVARPGL